MTMIVKDALEIAKDSYTDYSKYVIATRAYADATDGCKAVARRTIHASYGLPRRKVKSATAIGEIVKLHPHPTSIYGVIVGMASKYDCPIPLFETKGNFGGNNCAPAAERYTEVMLSDFAIKLYESFDGYVDMTTGEMDTDEPAHLAALLPLCFLHGTYGIPSGMTTVNIPPLNALDMVDYYIDVLKHKDLDYKSKVLVKPYVGNVLIGSTEQEWLDLINRGEGKILYRPVMNILDNRKLEITGLHPKKSIEHIEKILKQELDNDQIDVRDESTDITRIVVEIPPYRRVNIQTLYDKLLKGLSLNDTYRFIFADEGIAIKAGFPDIVKKSLTYVIKCCNRKFASELKNLEYKLSILETIEMLKSDKNVLKLIDLDNESAIKFLIETYSIDEKRARAVLSKPISYMTREHESEIVDVKKEIDINKSNTSDVYSYLLELYKSIKKDLKKIVKKDNECTRFDTTPINKTAKAAKVK